MGNAESADFSGRGSPITSTRSIRALWGSAQQGRKEARQWRKYVGWRAES
jgi:hypothetical protein